MLSVINNRRVLYCKILYPKKKTYEKNFYYDLSLVTKKESKDNKNLYCIKNVKYQTYLTIQEPPNYNITVKSPWCSLW